MIIDPNSIRSGPTAAAMAANFKICCCCAGSSFLKPSNSSVAFSISGTNVSASVSPTVYLNTSKVEESFSKGVMSASADSWAVPLALEMLSLISLRVASPGPLISASHFDIWFLPNKADAAAIFSSSVRPPKLFWSWSITSTIGSIAPFASKISILSRSIASLPSFAGAESLASPVFRALAPSEALMELSPNTPTSVAMSSKSHPTVFAIGPAMDMASNRPLTSVLA